MTISQRTASSWPAAAGAFLIGGLMLFSSACAPSPQHSPEHESYLEAYRQRGDHMVQHLANRIPATNFDEGGLFDVAARLRTGQDLEWCIARIETLIADPVGDLFFAWPLAMVMHEGQGKLPQDVMDKMRDVWRTYHVFRGDTENHHVIYYTSLYLISEMYINDGPETWFNGRSARENLAEAESYLRDWVRLATTIGQGEYDSPGYFSFFVGPVANLYGYTKNKEMKALMGDVLDLLIADFAAEIVDGVLVASRSRTWEGPAQHPWQESPTAFTTLIWDIGAELYRHEPMMLYMSGWEPSEIMANIATDRDESYEQIERKRTRHRVRYSDERNAPVYKYTWITPDYGMASAQGGLLQPIQQRTWMLHWRVDQPHADNKATFFALHPYSSPESMQMYFSEHREVIVELVARSKLPYNSPDKLVGESPYEQVAQYKDALIGLYDIPEGTRFPFISTFFSSDLDEVHELGNGWIIARGNRTWIGYYPLQKGSWHPSEAGSRRLQSDFLKNGYIVQVANTQTYPTREDFENALAGLTFDIDRSIPAVKYTALDGTRLEFAYNQRPVINGSPVDYDNWPLYKGPFINETGPQTFELRHGDKTQVLKF